MLRTIKSLSLSLQEDAHLERHGLVKYPQNSQKPSDPKSYQISLLVLLLLSFFIQKAQSIKKIPSLAATPPYSYNPSMDSPSKSYLFGVSAHKALLGFLLILSLAPSFAETQVSDEPTAYQMLEKYDFPPGILPQGVQSYVLNQDGSFEVYLSGDCEFKVEGGYLLKYKRRITGTVGSGSLTNLSGASVKVLFFWFGINEVVRSGDELKFYVGPLSASFALSNFEECPLCRCGFSCATAAAAAALVADS